MVGLVKRRNAALLLGIMALAAGFRLWGITWGLYDANVSRRPHPDEWPIYWLFQWFGSTHTLNPCPATARCFFDWGSVYPYLSYGVHGLLAPLLRVVPPTVWGSSADAAFVNSVLTGRLVSVLTSTMTVLVVFHLGSRAYGTATGLVASLLAALSGLLIQLAHFATPDSTTVLLVTLDLLAMTLAMKRPSAPRFALSGLLLGLAVGCEYHMVLLAIPLLVSWLLARPRQGSWLLAAGACALSALVISNVYALVDLESFLATAWHTVRIHTVDQQLQYQGRFAAYGPALLYVVRYPLGYGASAGLAMGMVLGVAWAAVRRERSDLLLLAWVLPYFLLLTLSPAKFMRYGAPLFPPLVVLGARFLAQLLRERPGAVRYAAAALAALALLFASADDAAYAGLFTRPPGQQIAASWMQKHVAPGSLVGFESLPTGLLDLPYFVADAGFRPCVLQFESQRLAGPVRYVLTDRYALEEHPRITTAQVLRFRGALASSPAYRVVERVDETPTFLGIPFPIDASPHDWRYPDRTITIYQHVTPSDGTAAYCFSSIARATAALYPPAGTTTTAEARKGTGTTPPATPR